MIKGAVENSKASKGIERQRRTFFVPWWRRVKDAIIAIDSGGIITIFNLAAEEIFGYKKEDVTGKSLDFVNT